MRVLILTEDTTVRGKDNSYLTELVEHILTICGDTDGRAILAANPHPGGSWPTGVDWLLDYNNSIEIINLYLADIDIVIVFIDRDRKEDRLANVEILEQNIRQRFPRLKTFVAVGHEELETWILYDVEFQAGKSWEQLRRIKDVKGRYFKPVSRSLGMDVLPDEGRTELLRQALLKFDDVTIACSKERELQELRNFLCREIQSR